VRAGGERGTRIIAMSKLFANGAATLSVAVIGGRTVANLLRGGFPGPIYPSNPKRPRVQGLPAYHSTEATSLKKGA